VTTVSRTALVRYSAAQMYRLVNAVEAYPEFLPWCRRVQVLYQDEDEIKASIQFSKGGIATSFTTRNRLQRHKMIEVQLVDGPFRHLQGFWRFENLGDAGSRVALDMEFELANPLLRVTLGPVFNQVTNTLVDAFVRRARQVYGA
jgi:ribosome-associated toxin RatA of RatAB toxin-antitoxin module